MLRFFYAAFAALICLCLPVAMFAQGTVGTLNGTVTDPGGAVVPGATVVATNNATQVEYRATSTNTGTYTIPYVPSGTYTVRVTAPGFRTAEATNIILRVAQTITVDVRLEVGQVSEQVVVSDRPELLEADSAEMGRYITTEEYKSWPVFVDDGQRQIQQFIFDSLPGTTGGTFQGSINGGQQYSHEILIEGMPVGRSDLSGGNNNEFSPSAEAIGEFKLQTGAVGAEYNGGQTAVANFQIKSGTNDPHGSAFYYVQNEAFNAQDIQSKSAGEKAPRYRLNNWGYSLGGPVYIPKIYNGRNKTFFFTNLEKTKQDDFVYSGFATLPATPFRSGDFSGLLNPAFTGNPLSGTQIGTDALGRPIIFGQIYDPKTTRTVNGATVRDPFPNNQIPTSAFDPVAANILSQYGYPQPAFGTMIRNMPQIGTCCPYFNEWIVGAKVDHQIGQNHRLSGYYNQSSRRRNNNGGQRYLPVAQSPSNTWTEQYTPGNMVRLSLTSTISPTVINRLAAGYNRFVNQNGTPAAFVNQGYASALGLQNLPGTIFPSISYSGAEWQGGTIAGMGAGYADYSANGSYIYQDDVTWIHGSHSVRFGYEYKNYYYNDRSLSDAGSFSFSPLQTGLPAWSGTDADVNQGTGNAFASFLLGAARNASHGIVGLSWGFRQPQHGVYVMDDWKVTPKLTLNVGLRWEIIPPLSEVTGRMSEIDLNAPNPEAGNRPGALVFKSQVNDTYWKQISPRFGIAYRATDKLVVRAGYAILNTPPIANDWGYGGFVYGYNANVNVPAQGAINQPALYLSQPFPAYQGSLPNTDPSSANFSGGMTTTAPDANRPTYTQNWNFSIQYQLPGETVLEVAYVGNKGTRAWGGTAYNQLDVLPASMLSMGSILNEPVSEHPEYIPFPGFPTDRSVAQALRPYPQFDGVSERFPYNTNTNYNALQVTATRHLTTNLSFLAAYTWSKTMTFVDSNGPSGYGTNPQDYFNRGLDRSIAAFNLPHTFKLTWVYETPFGKGRRWDLGSWLNPILGGWQIAAIHNYTTGYPISVYESGVNVPAGFAGGIRPDVTGAASALGAMPGTIDAQVPTAYLNPGAFVHSPVTANGTPLRVGTAPRLLPDVRGPAYYSENGSMRKRFYFSEKSFLQVGATLSNLFKRTQPYIVDTTIGNSQFGMVQLGGGDRRLQLEGRFEF